MFTQGGPSGQIAGWVDLDLGVLLICGPYCSCLLTKLSRVMEHHKSKSTKPNHMSCIKCNYSGVLLFDLPVPGVEFVPVGHHSRLAVVEERREVDPVVPVLREVPDLAVRQHGLQTKIRYFDTQLGYLTVN